MPVVTCIDDLERSALGCLGGHVAGFIQGGADEEQTLKDNIAAYSRYRLRPRALVDISTIDLTRPVLGHQVSMPIGVAPAGAVQKLAHPDGECATAKAAEAMGAVFIISNVANCTLDEVGAAAPKAIKWFQIYFYKDRDLSEAMIRRAENAGFSAIVLSVDTKLFGNRLAQKRTNFKQPPHVRPSIFEQALKDTNSQEKQTSSIDDFIDTYYDASVTWEYISWLRSISRLPVLVKGIMTPEDALLAAKHGASAVIVSNHGGRQLDGCLATVDALRPIVAALAGRLPVYMDGGVRRGTDVLKALALGASMVFVGRPMLWGLAHDGQRGAQLALTLLRDELRLAMGLCGVTKVADINEQILEGSHQSQL